jgi:hypothetical protein
LQNVFCCPGASSFETRSPGVAGGGAGRRLIFVPSTACFNRAASFLTLAIQLLLTQSLDTSAANLLFCTYCTVPFLSRNKKKIKFVRKFDADT